MLCGRASAVIESLPLGPGRRGRTIFRDLPEWSGCRAGADAGCERPAPEPGLRAPVRWAAGIPRPVRSAGSGCWILREPGSRARQDGSGKRRGETRAGSDRLQGRGDDRREAAHCGNVKRYTVRPTADEKNVWPGRKGAFAFSRIATAFPLRGGRTPQTIDLIMCALPVSSYPPVP